MIASGVLLPLMDLVFGKFVTVFNNFIIGKITPAEFRSSLNDYTYVNSPLPSDTSCGAQQDAEIIFQTIFCVSLHSQACLCIHLDRKSSHLVF